jgi:hypothetical protein
MILSCSSDIAFSQTTSGTCNILVTASMTSVDAPCKLTIWKNKVGLPVFYATAWMSIIGIGREEHPVYWWE